jgi:hypothetical protein
VDEVTFTESTLAETAEASGLLENEVTALENLEPSWSRASRWLSDVDESKNFSQAAVIAAVGEEAAGELGLDAGLALAVGLALGLAAGLLAAELELPLEQAVVATASNRPIAGTRYIRWNRMWCASLGPHRILRVL